MFGGTAQRPFERAAGNIHAKYARLRMCAADKAQGRRLILRDAQGANGSYREIETKFVRSDTVHGYGFLNTAANALIRVSASLSVNACGSLPSNAPMR